MQQARIAHVDLPSAHLALAEILVPGLQLPHDEGIRHLVEAAANGGVGQPHRSADFGSVPKLTVGVREHRAEPVHRLRARRNAELRQIPREEDAQESLPPIETVALRARRIGAREPAFQSQFAGAIP